MALLSLVILQNWPSSRLTLHPHCTFLNVIAEARNGTSSYMKSSHIFHWMFKCLLIKLGIMPGKVCVHMNVVFTDVKKFLACSTQMYSLLGFCWHFGDNVHACQSMMTSSNGNIFRVTGHLYGEFTGSRWIPHTKASDAELWCFLWSVSGDLRRCRAHYDVTVMLWQIAAETLIAA